MSVSYTVNTYRPMSTLYIEDTKCECCNDQGIAIVKFDSAEAAKLHVIHWKSLGFDVTEVKPTLTK